MKRLMSAPFVLSVLALLWADSVFAPAGALQAQIFQSSHAANLPTTTTLPRGNLLFEISHRFTPAVSEGSDALWGLDGPVINRLGLSYALTERSLVGVTRSNLFDNVELGARVRLLEGGSGALPWSLGVAGTVAWNMSPGAQAEDNETQALLQLMLNAGLGERVAIGLVPTYLRNPRIQDVEAADAFVLGLHGQVAVARSVNLIGEWIFTEARAGQEFDSGTFGVELRTRGHFFKIVLTNQVRMNPSQALGGSGADFSPDEWRLGFNITRRLAF